MCCYETCPADAPTDEQPDPDTSASVAEVPDDHPYADELDLGGES